MLSKTGAAYVAVPDAFTFTDILYRLVLRDRGGLVNLFTFTPTLAISISWHLGLPHAATRVLQSSLVFLILIPRTIDKRASSRLRVYGWACFLGNLDEALDLTPRLNVCVPCGQAHPGHYLDALPLLRPTPLPWPNYRCPGCGCDIWFVHKIGIGPLPPNPTPPAPHLTVRESFSCTKPY